MSRGLRSLRHKLVVLAMSAAVSVVAAELVFRWYEARFLLRDSTGAVDGEVVDLAALVYNDTVVPRRLPEGEYRVLGLADSLSFGPVENPYTYYSIAGRELDRLGLSRRFRFVNLGEPGITFDHYIQRYRHWSNLIEHDAAVFTVFLGNDFLEVALGFAPVDLELNQGMRELGVEIRAGRRRQVVPGKYPLRLLDYARLHYLLWSGAATPHRPGENDPYHPFALQLSAAAYRDVTLAQLANFEIERLPALRPAYEAMVRYVRFVSSVRRSGVPAAIVLAPNESQVSPRLRAQLAGRDAVDLERLDFALPGRLVVEAARQIDPELPVLDLSGSMEAASARGMSLYYGTNTHWSIAGHELAGACLAGFLAERWFGVPAPSGPGAGDLCGRPYLPSEAPLRVDDTRQRMIDAFLTSLLGDQPAPIDRVPAADLARFERRRGTTLQGIQAINQRRFWSLPTVDGVATVPARSDGFFVAGWAVDAGAEDLAGGVLVEIDGTAYRAGYGLPREDVARERANSKYGRCGFLLALPADEVPLGQRRLKILTLSHDGRGLDESEPVSIRLEGAIRDEARGP